MNPMPVNPPFLEVSGLSKTYGGVHALSDVGLTLTPGEVHALLGENGAGKSTFIKCLSGAVRPDAGKVRVDGALLPPGDLRAAEAAGIVALHQESTAFPHLSAVDNIFVGREPHRAFGLLDRPRMEREARGLMERLGENLDLHRPLEELSLASRQMVGLARALSHQSRLLILDEPTASLSARETQTLFRIIRQLQSEGVAVLYISHRLEEVYALASRVTVLRDGRLVGTYPPTASGTLTELRLHYHADPDATRDIVFPAVPLRLATVQNQAQAPYAAWAALCQDPDPSLTLSPPCAYAEVPWNPSAGLRNGVYDLTSAVTVTGSDGVTRTWTSPPFTVDREDLLITSTVPVNPTPLLWDPDKLNPATGAPDALPLSAAFHAAYKATGTATVQVYSSDQTLVRTLTKALLTTDGTTDAGGTVLWDGRGEPANGQPGAVQPRGVYLFQWTLTDSLGVTDCDKSVSLTTTVTTNDATLTSDDSISAVFNINYNLASADTPPRSGSGGSIDVYDPDGSVCSSQALTAASSLTPGPHTAVVSMPSPQLDGNYTFLSCVQDSDATNDRGSRARYALQHNNRYFSARIAFLQLGGMYVVWVHGGKHIKFVTSFDPNGQAHYPYAWVHNPAYVSPTVYPPLRIPFRPRYICAATNGIFFATGTHGSTTVWFPLGEVGPSWNHFQDLPVQRWCFGMSVTGGDFVCERMVRRRLGSFVVHPRVRAKQMGMSDAGLLVTTDIDPATGQHIPPHAPQEVPEAYNGTAIYPWPSSYAAGDEMNRTAIAWTANGDFFLICGHVPGASVRSTYSDMADFIINTLPNDAAVARFHVNIKTGMMVDGGGASELSYLDANLSHSAELLPTGSARATSHLCTMIGVYTPQR